MTEQKIIQIIVCTAKDQLNIYGLDGAKQARRLIDALSAIELCGGVFPEEIEHAYQQVERKEEDIRAGKPPKPTILPSQTQQEEVLAWLKQPWKGELLTRKGKNQIEECIRFFEDYWA